MRQRTAGEKKQCCVQAGELNSNLVCTTTSHVNEKIPSQAKLHRDDHREHFSCYLGANLGIFAVICSRAKYIVRYL